MLGHLAKAVPRAALRLLYLDGEERPWLRSTRRPGRRWIWLIYVVGYGLRRVRMEEYEGPGIRWYDCDCGCDCGL